MRIVGNIKIIDYAVLGLSFRKLLLVTIKNFDGKIDVIVNGKFLVVSSLVSSILHLMLIFWTQTSFIRLFYNSSINPDVPCTSG